MGHAESCNSIFDYLKVLQLIELDELYGHPPTCLIVFRELPEISKHLVMRLLFLEQNIPKSIVSGWISKSSQTLLSEACSNLSDLRIWHSIDSNSARGSWRLNKTFQDSMKISLFGGGEQLLGDLGSTTADKHPKDVSFLDNYASERWDSILHFMVGSDSGEVGTCVRDVLRLSGLMKKGGADLSIGITQRGFQFLLMDRQAQVLRFILHYFDYLKEKKNNLVQCLQFIFQLSFLSTLKSYPTDILSEAQLDILQNMRELGLAYQRKRTAPRFYITRLALSLAFGCKTSAKGIGSLTSEPINNSQSITQNSFLGHLPTGVSMANQKFSKTSSVDVGFILLETNFRLYAYTDSPLRTALLSLFSKIRVRYPNLVVADITRDSVRQALLRGISANQIISFLTTNAHPDMLLHNPILPPTLVDQIRLWELERDRLSFQAGCLYEQFAKNTDFEMVRDYAKSQNSLLWENSEKRLMVVSKAGHEDVRKFWKQKRLG